MKRTAQKMGIWAVLLLWALSALSAYASSDTQDNAATQTPPPSRGFVDDAANWYYSTSENVSTWAGETSGNVANWAGEASDNVANWAGDTSGNVANWFGDTTNTVSGWFGGGANEAAPTPAPEVKIMPMSTLPPNALIHYLGSAVNTGTDNGYSATNKIGASDPHFGWTLGSFFVSGYTRVSADANGTPVFLKTVGDKVTLWFALEQDITKLNGDSALTIASDNNGFDEHFGIKPTNFEHGALIVRHADFQNAKQTPALYTNYLVANAITDAMTEVELFEEGDYEVALNYEVKRTSYKVIDAYNNYRIFFQFSVRNGNCMVYPFDIATKAELTNTAITENGFYLDLAKSRYLDINIKKEVLTTGATGLTEDTRFNRPAKDGDEYTDEGIYTITASNRYTAQQTIKKIYVGTNNILKAHMTTGLSVKEIEDLLAQGAEVNDEGLLIPAA